MIVKENVENNTCLIKDWDSYIEKTMRFFIKEIGNVMIPSDTRLQFEEQPKSLEIVLPKERLEEALFLLKKL